MKKKTDKKPFTSPNPITTAGYTRNFDVHFIQCQIPTDKGKTRKMQAKKDEAKCIYQHYNESGVLDCATFGSRLMILNYWMQIIFLIRKGKSKTTVHFEAISVKNLSKDASLLQKRIGEKDAKRMMQKKRDFTLWCRNTHLCSKKRKDIAQRRNTYTWENSQNIPIQVPQSKIQMVCNTKSMSEIRQSFERPNLQS